MFEERKKEVLAKVEFLKSQAARYFGIDMPNIDVRFDLVGRAAGMAGRRSGQYYMRFNRDMMMNDSWPTMIGDTVPHELAHIVCYVNPKLGRNHDWGWRAVCRRLGGSGDRCHEEPVQYARGTVYYTTSTGATVSVSLNRHSKIQRGREYIWKDGSRVNKSCAYTTRSPQSQSERVTHRTEYLPAPDPQAVTASPVVISAPSRPGTNAERVRERIAQAKRNGENEHVVIQWAVMTLGQSRGLARSYVMNNWPKVRI